MASDNQKSFLAEVGQERCLCQASQSTFALVWPWALTSWPQSWSFYALAPWTTFNWHQNNSFSKYCVHKFGCRQTKECSDERMDRL